MSRNGQLTVRQRRELEYHRGHAKLHEERLEDPISFDIVTSSKRRWWNAHWEMYSYLLDKGLKEKYVLVVGCGFGDDVLYLAKAGAKVSGFDLSPESLSIARRLGARERLNIDLQEMPAERLDYKDNTFDMVVARDILHHVNIPLAMSELVRVSKPGAVFCFNEVYSHSITDRVRRSKFVEGWLYPKMVRFIYSGEKPYITEDERKLTEKDVRTLLGGLHTPEIHKYFNFLIDRVLPDKSMLLRRFDRLVLKLFYPLAPLLGGRVLVALKIKS